MVVDPNIDVSPANLSSTQDPNTTTNQTLTVANTGGGTLNWQIAEEPAALPPMANAPGYAPGDAAVHDAAGAVGAAPAAPANVATWQRPEVALDDPARSSTAPALAPAAWTRASHAT